MKIAASSSLYFYQLLSVASAFVSLSQQSTTDLQACGSHRPLAHVKNGTLRGLHLTGFQQDIFLGVPFAQPPVGSLRLRHPARLNESWSGVRGAVSRSPSCPGYAGFDEGLLLGEGGHTRFWYLERLLTFGDLIQTA